MLKCFQDKLNGVSDIMTAVIGCDVVYDVASLENALSILS